MYSKRVHCLCEYLSPSLSLNSHFRFPRVTHFYYREGEFFTYHRCSHRNHLSNPSRRYRRDHARCSCHHRRRGNRPGRGARLCAAEASHDAPCSCSCSSSPTPSSRRSASQCRSTDRQDNGWLEDPAEWRERERKSRERGESHELRGILHTVTGLVREGLLTDEVH